MSTKLASCPAPLFSHRFARSYVTTMRPYLLFLSGVVGLAGLALVPGLAPLDAVIVGLACFCSYGFGQALTDCFQMDTDALSAPYRPLIRGVVRRRHVLVVSLIGLGTVGGVLVVYEPRNLTLVGGAIVGLATYTWFKRRPWAGPVYNAAIVLLLFSVAHLAGRGAVGSAVRPFTALSATGAAVFLGYANFVLAGYFKDRRADARTGYRTLPVVCGFRVSARISDVLALATAVSVGVAAVSLSASARGGDPVHGLDLGLTAVLVALGWGSALVGQIRLHRVRREAGAHRAIAPVLDGLVLQLAGITALARPIWAPWLVLYVATYRWTLRRRPATRQI